MHTCVICRFEIPLDDAIAPTGSGRCLCLSCFARETGNTLAMPKQLRLELTAILEIALTA